MSSQYIGIEEGRKRLGDLVTAVQQGADIVLTRNGKPAARIVRYQEEPMITMAELAAQVGMSSAPEKVAAFVGALTEHDPRTGQLAKRWAGQGMDATFTREEADAIVADWNAHWRSAEILEYVSSEDAEAVEIADRYRP
jgi:prevent-host-death family protein